MNDATFLEIRKKIDTALAAAGNVGLMVSAELYDEFKSRGLITMEVEPYGHTVVSDPSPVEAYKKKHYIRPDPNYEEFGYEIGETSA
jgi:hypothetical protein